MINVERCVVLRCELRVQAARRTARRTSVAIYAYVCVMRVGMLYLSCRPACRVP
jgi:hypothetical protein